MSKKEEFKVGDRVFFLRRHGFYSFGFVIEVHSEDSTLLIRGDDGVLYERLMSSVSKPGENDG